MVTNRRSVDLRAPLPPLYAEARDGELLSRFLDKRDEAAFDTLFHRHSAMVWSICRRILNQPQDAQDAFQGTFLLLVRKGRTIAKKESLASWLHSVARRTALTAATRRGRRRVCENVAGSQPAPTPRDEYDPSWREAQAILDDEVHRLPEKLRAAVVLCYLQGNTLAEAARQLACPLGTIATRLDRARALLRPRLAGRGVTGPVALLVAALLHDTTSAHVPSVIAAATLGAARRTAVESAAGAFPAAVVALARAAAASGLAARLTSLLAAGGALAILAGMTLASDPVTNSNGPSEATSPVRPSLPLANSGAPQPPSEPTLPATRTNPPVSDNVPRRDKPRVDVIQITDVRMVDPDVPGIRGQTTIMIPHQLGSPDDN